MEGQQADGRGPACVFHWPESRDWLLYVEAELGDRRGSSGRAVSWIPASTRMFQGPGPGCGGEVRMRGCGFVPAPWLPPRNPDGLRAGLAS